MIAGSVPFSRLYYEAGEAHSKDDSAWNRSHNLYTMQYLKETRLGMTYHRKWDRYRHVDANLASLDVLLEACSR